MTTPENKTAKWLREFGVMLEHDGYHFRLQLEEAAKEIEALQADADRYRWLKSEEAYEGWLPGWYDGAGYGRHSFHFKTEIKDLDAAIDAARKDQP